MANIPVERTEKATPWWLWLLGALLLALLIWFLISAFGGDDEEVAVVDDTEDVAVAPAALDLSSVYVTRVVGDRTFFVAPTPDGTDETLVVLEEEPTPGDATEGRYDVTEGQHLSITGSIEPTSGLDFSTLEGVDAATAGDQYVRATALTVLDEADDMTDDAAGGEVDGEVGGPITSLDGISARLAGAVGERVSLSGVRVSELAGDSTFYLGTGADRVLVVLESLGESESGPGTGADGRYDINVGDVLSIEGEVQPFEAGMRGGSGVTASGNVITVRDGGSLTKQ